MPGDFRPYEFLRLLYDPKTRPDDLKKLESEVIVQAAKEQASARILNLAIEVFLKDGNFASARDATHRALGLGLDTIVVCGLQQQYPELKAIECR